MPDRQYVLSVPREGFNDVLCQMGFAWSYAERHGRVFVTDTRHSSLQDAFSRYFSTQAKGVLLHPGEALLRHFDSLNVYPSCLRGRVSLACQKSYLDTGSAKKTICAEGFIPRIDSDTGQPLAFDMSSPYQEDLLVCDVHGVGLGLGLACLQRLKLLPEVALRIALLLAALGEDYDAVHIRNTDIGTDYLSFFRQIFPLVQGRKLLICSDDLVCREVAKKFFVESQVLTVTDIPNTGGRALHFFAQDIYAKNIAMLTDLFALARAQRLFATPITTTKGLNKMKKGQLSGFSILALSLHAHQNILDGLFADLPGENGWRSNTEKF